MIGKKLQEVRLQLEKLSVRLAIEGASGAILERDFEKAYRCFDADIHKI